MVPIACEKKWEPLLRVIRWLANGDVEKEARFLICVCQAFTDGHGVPLLLVDKVNGQLLSPKDPQLPQYIIPLADRLLVCKDDVPEIACWCKVTPPSCCSDSSKDASQPSRSPGELLPASVDIINVELRYEYDRAEAAREKPPNVKQVPPVVQLRLKQKGRRASKSQIEKLAAAEEFKLRRWPPGKTVASERRKKPDFGQGSERPRA